MSYKAIDIGTSWPIINPDQQRNNNPFASKDFLHLKIIDPQSDPAASIIYAPGGQIPQHILQANLGQLVEVRVNSKHLTVKNKEYHNHRVWGGNFHDYPILEKTLPVVPKPLVLLTNDVVRKTDSLCRYPILSTSESMWPLHEVDNPLPQPPHQHIKISTKLPPQMIKASTAPATTTATTRRGQQKEQKQQQKEQQEALLKQQQQDLLKLQRSEIKQQQIQYLQKEQDSLNVHQIPPNCMACLKSTMNPLNSFDILRAKQFLLPYPQYEIDISPTARLIEEQPYRYIRYQHGDHFYTEDSDIVAMLHHSGSLKLSLTQPTFNGISVILRILPTLSYYPSTELPYTLYRSRTMFGGANGRGVNNYKGFTLQIIRTERLLHTERERYPSRSQFFPRLPPIVFLDKRDQPGLFYNNYIRDVAIKSTPLSNIDDIDEINSTTTTTTTTTTPAPKTRSKKAKTTMGDSDEVKKDTNEPKPDSKTISRPKHIINGLILSTDIKLPEEFSYEKYLLADDQLPLAASVQVPSISTATTSSKPPASKRPVKEKEIINSALISSTTDPLSVGTSIGLVDGELKTFWGLKEAEIQKSTTTISRFVNADKQISKVTINRTFTDDLFYYSSFNSDNLYLSYRRGLSILNKSHYNPMLDLPMNPSTIPFDTYFPLNFNSQHLNNDPSFHLPTSLQLLQYNLELITPCCLFLIRCHGFIKVQKRDIFAAPVIETVPEFPPIPQLQPPGFKQQTQNQTTSSTITLEPIEEEAPVTTKSRKRTKANPKATDKSPNKPTTTKTASTNTTTTSPTAPNNDYELVSLGDHSSSSSLTTIPPAKDTVIQHPLNTGLDTQSIDESTDYCYEPVYSLSTIAPKPDIPYMFNNTQLTQIRHIYTFFMSYLQCHQPNSISTSSQLTVATTTTTTTANEKKRARRHSNDDENDTSAAANRAGNNKTSTSSSITPLPSTLPTPIGLAQALANLFPSPPSTTKKTNTTATSTKNGSTAMVDLGSTTTTSATKQPPTKAQQTLQFGFKELMDKLGQKQCFMTPFTSIPFGDDKVKMVLYTQTIFEIIQTTTTKSKKNTPAEQTKEQLQLVGFGINKLPSLDYRTSQSLAAYVSLYLRQNNPKLSPFIPIEYTKLSFYDQQCGKSIPIEVLGLILEYFTYHRNTRVIASNLTWDDFIWTEDRLYLNAKNGLGYQYPATGDILGLRFQLK
jgi:hypothetical protein